MLPCPSAEDRTHEGGIRSSCLPAICPARLPARRPSVSRRAYASFSRRRARRPGRTRWSPRSGRGRGWRRSTWRCCRGGGGGDGPSPLTRYPGVGIARCRTRGRRRRRWRPSRLGRRSERKLFAGSSQRVHRLTEGLRSSERVVERLVERLKDCEVRDGQCARRSIQVGWRAHEVRCKMQAGGQRGGRAAADRGTQE